ncbi:MAG: tetratricopeptide repeat protein [Bacteroidales bacterium]|nr:tetratricopeptide repeat protein [Bacteroidales bacterium]
MKIKFLLSLFMGSALSLSAQGYLDGVEYYRADQTNAAKTILERTLNDAGTDKATSYYYLGQIAIKNNDKAKAKENFEKGVAADANNPYNYVGLAALDLANGDKKAADENVKMAKKLGKKDAQLLVDIARIYFEADPVAYDKDIQKAMKDALKINKEEASYYIFIGDTIAATAGSDNVKVGNAAGMYENAILYAPNSAVAYVKYSSLYEKVNPTFSVQKMREYLKTNPNSALAQRELAARLYDAGRWTQAVAAYEECIKNPSHLVEDEERYATLLMSGEKYEDAYNVAKGVVSRTENPNQMYRVMMHSKNSLKDYNEAVKWAEELMKTKATSKIVEIDYLTYGEVLEGLATVDTANASNYIDKAVAQYKEILNMNNKYIPAYKALSNLYRNINDYANAVNYYDQFVATGEAKAGDYHTYAGLILNYANRQVEVDSIGAQAIYDKAVDAATIAVDRSNNPYAQERKAIILFSKNQGVITAEVAQAFEKVVEMLDVNPKNIQEDPDTYKKALAFIGDYYTKVGENEKALAAYNRYLTIDPTKETVINRINYLNELIAKEAAEATE